ncbi:MAG TPA: hypothetical protein VEH80_01510 [Candidatus Bathyarchaeia archaeon]|nr:hypothetical protein [Candidatus Bathyarchaeia archaeon]
MAIDHRLSVGERWSAARPTKTLMFWSWVAVVLLTLVVGFHWGGWVTGATARSMAETASQDAILGRLAPICALQARHDPSSAAKLKEMAGMDSWSRADYVIKQGWATMPGEHEADRRVAEQCVTLLAPGA